MTDTTGSSPFAGFAGFPPAGLFDKMWEMMRLSPFGGMAGLPGSAQGLPPSLSAMSDLMAPLASVEELDKRITDLRAVEQWLKLNLNMLQSAIQALEVQRATLATLRAFGALAQSSMEAAEAAVASAEPGVAPPSAAGAPAAEATAGAGPESAGQTPEAFDPAGWWNLLQSQFNQLASFAMTQPGAAAAPASPAGKEPAARQAAPKPAAAKPAAARRTASPRPGAAAEPPAEGAPRAAKKAAKRSA
ncbi:hypothetical protein Bsp3421_005668 [Burkholderia sp. FERM BP-3421]|jgi:hypothetical protein|uniref:PhaM family polyhydroxyalkanoate granule multifunctional regulatory protein n=1 Tax=Burkholderia sp. FERM BP-3421 TaxID=1494466 RepID=UPI00235E9371|nr:PhaM family polyhydroxyalkanoate granule multifunctional regulatory protein [Burkholderia sp. FERM BP-3421]WDD95492.1 hypothetical protein Bsp3421_005668 [Burkholderia sp. FERM BP-3421]